MTAQEIRNQVKLVRQHLGQGCLETSDGDRILDLLLEVLDQDHSEPGRFIQMGRLVIDIKQVTYISDSGTGVTFKLRDGEFVRLTGEDAESARATVKGMVDNLWIESLESIANVGV